MSFNFQICLDFRIDYEEIQEKITERPFLPVAWGAAIAVFAGESEAGPERTAS